VKDEKKTGNSEEQRELRMKDEKGERPVNREKNEVKTREREDRSRGRREKREETEGAVK
jgi:hypothetical protein